MLTKFVGKTTEMNLKIFNAGAGQGAIYELSKFISIKNLKGHQVANAIKALKLTTYTKPPETTFKYKTNSYLSYIKQKLELYKYEALLNKLKK